MNRSVFSLSAFFVLALLVMPAAAGPPAVGERFPDIMLSAPGSADSAGYLGVPATDPFGTTQFQGKVLIIEIFSMYCPFCQKEAPQVNRLYRAIEARKETAGKVKLIGIGAGNSPMEVDLFRQTYEIPFPLFPDGDLSIHKQVGEVRTPYFFALKRGDGGGLEVIAAQLGAIADVEAYLEKIVRGAGLRK